jgi:hypothetical protein
MNAMKTFAKLLTRRNILIGLFVLGVVVAVYVVMQPTSLPGMEYFTEKKEDGEECEENSDCQSDNCKEGACQPKEEFENHEDEEEETQDEKPAKEGFANMEQGSKDANVTASNPNVAQLPAQQGNGLDGLEHMNSEFAPLEGGNNVNVNKPANPASCFPRDSLAPDELLPRESSEFSAFAPMGQGNLKGRNFLQTEKLIGVNTVGSSLRNANQQLRSEPPNPRVAVSVFNNSTITEDHERRHLEIGSGN